MSQVEELAREWLRLDKVFQAVLSRYILSDCGQNPSTRNEIEQLLAENEHVELLKRLG